MSYLETLDYLFAKLPMFHRIGASAYKADLTNTVALCYVLGNPQDDFKSVHVAGTNGKGSVCHLLASILQETGLKVGLYTSPHLKDFRERIRVNGKMIPKRYVTGFVEKYKPEFEKLQLSFFEMTVGLAFQYFSDEKVDIAVVEVGLGGRLDSTNIITPLLSVITNISFDYMQFFGDILEKIAAEKAGIIKAGVPVVIGEIQVEVKDVFIKKARSTGSEIVFADAVFALAGSYSPQRREDAKNLSALEPSRLKDTFDISRNDSFYITGLECPLLGWYQKKNLLTVFAAFEVLKAKGLRIPEGSIRKGIRNVIRNTGLQGRWHILSESPLTICDAGHNEAGIKEVLEQIRQTPHKKLHFVFGLVNDKQIDHILEMLPANAKYYFCKADIPRGLPQEELRIKANAAGLMGESYSSVKNALETARKNARSGDLVFVGGSTFVVAEVV